MRGGMARPGQMARAQLLTCREGRAGSHSDEGGQGHTCSSPSMCSRFVAASKALSRSDDLDNSFEETSNCSAMSSRRGTSLRLAPERSSAS